MKEIRLLTHYDENFDSKYQNNNHYKELKAYLIYAIGVIFITLSSMQAKFMKNNFPLYYTVNSFIFWRSLTMMFIVVSVLGKNIKTEYRKIGNLKLLIIRTAGNYFIFIFLILSMDYIRSSTAMCLSSIHPSFAVIFAYFILKESFHLRYLIGIILCVIGASLMLLNNNTLESDKDSIVNLSKPEIGLFLGFVHSIGLAYLQVISKILLNKGVNTYILIFYFGLLNGLMALTVSILLNEHYGGFYYIITCCFNGVLFYAANYLFFYALKQVEISKIVPINYLTVIVSFLFGSLFFNEPCYLKDIIGAAMILGYNVYNAFVPIN